MANITMSFQVVPLVEESRLYSVVDEAIAVVAESGVPYEVGAFETTMEGDIDHLWQIVCKAQQACLQSGASRVMTTIKMDLAPQGTTIGEKIDKYRRT